MAIHKSYQLGHSLSREVTWGKLAFPSFKRFFYNLFWIPLKLAFGYFANIEVESQENLAKLEGPLIIASSHGSWSDSFIIGICFPFNAKISPVRYAVWWKYYYFPLFTFLLWLFGSFPVRKGVGLDKSLAVPLEILKEGGCVGIFPTGKRARKRDGAEPPKAKRGVSYLALKSKTKILPIKIEGNVGMKFRDFLKRKCKIKVKIGKAFYLKDAGSLEENLLNESADLVMGKILSL